MLKKSALERRRHDLKSKATKATLTPMNSPKPDPAPQTPSGKPVVAHSVTYPDGSGFVRYSNGAGIHLEARCPYSVCDSSQISVLDDPMLSLAGTPKVREI